MLDIQQLCYTVSSKIWRHCEELIYSRHCERAARGNPGITQHVSDCLKAFNKSCGFGLFLDCHALRARNDADNGGVEC